MKIIKIVVALLLFIITLALGAQNQQIVDFNYLVAQGQFHLSTLLGLMFIIGFLFALIVFSGMLLKSQLRVKKLNRKLQKITKENVALSVDKS